MSKLLITILGTGNVATHLTRFFTESDGARVNEIYGRTVADASKLAEFAGCGFTDRVSALCRDSRVYILAVSDDAVEKVASELPDLKGAVVHTSGSLGLDVLNRFSSCGVFYPLQTFSKSKPVDWSRVVVCVEGSDQKTEDLLCDLARDRTKKVEIVNSESRAVLHIAAVFACNFSNHMFAISHELLRKKGMSFDMMESLVRETVDKAFAREPGRVQTGPAIRGDEGILKKHREYLAGKKGMLTLYNKISQSILNTKNQNNEHNKH